MEWIILTQLPHYISPYSGNDVSSTNFFSKQTKKDSGPSPGLEGDQVEEGEVGAGEVGDSPVSSLPDTAASTPS